MTNLKISRYDNGIKPKDLARQPANPSREDLRINRELKKVYGEMFAFSDTRQLIDLILSNLAAYNANLRNYVKNRKEEILRG